MDLIRRSFYKRSFDITVLSASHIALLPVLAILWIIIPAAIYLNDRGPIFYRQKRKGLRGREFTALKFRTMIPNADTIGDTWTREGDTRITAVGRVLRKTALDELPQLLCIWKGDMSWVGPRALETKEHAMLESTIPGFERRLEVRPGLTGMAQVYNVDDRADAKLKYDLEYIERMSPVLDARLMLFSVLNTLAGRWDRRGGKRVGDPAAPAEKVDRK